MPEPAEVAR
jgi:hypothetical protein